MSKILITGGAGFIGSNLAKRLHREGNDVIILDNLSTGRTENLKDCDVEVHQRDIIHRFEIPCDQIYHLAAPASPPAYQADPVRTIRTIVDGTYNALECARVVGARILIASTSEVYGEPIYHPQVETQWMNVNPIGRRACYNVSKAVSEALAIAYEAKGVSVALARIFNTYGPNMSPDDGRVVSNFVCQALAGDPITVYGEGTQTRSFCYIDDMLDGLIGLMTSGLTKVGPVNLGNPRELPINDIAEIILRMTQSESKIQFRTLPNPDDPGRRQPNIHLAKQLFDFTPMISLEEGLIKTIDYFRGQV